MSEQELRERCDYLIKSLIYLPLIFGFCSFFGFFFSSFCCFCDSYAPAVVRIAGLSEEYYANRD